MSCKYILVYVFVTREILKAEQMSASERVEAVNVTSTVIK